MDQTPLANAERAFEKDKLNEQLFSVRYWRTVDEFVATLAGSDELSNIFDASPLQYKAILTSFEAISFGLGPRDQVRPIAFATLRHGRLNTRLALTIPNSISGSDPFWKGVHDFAKNQRVTLISVENIGGDEKTPAFTDEVKRNNALNYVLYLYSFDDYSLAKNHLRNIKKADRAGVRLVWRPERLAMGEHLRLWTSSMDRRRARGERIISPLDRHRVQSLLRSGYGRIYQAELDGEVVSSILIVKIGDRAFYDSGGTSPKGMHAGTAYFLMYKIIRVMKEYGCTMLSMGATSPQLGGLMRFKQGFGSVPRPFEILERRFNTPIKALLDNWWGLRGQGGDFPTNSH